MAITTLAGVQAGMQWARTFAKESLSLAASQYCSTWGRAGTPVAGSFDTTLNGVTLTSPVAGQIPWNNPASGNTYIASLQAALGGSTVTSGAIIVADRLWHNGGFTITSTSAQSITSPTWPARDATGATSGLGVLLGVEVSATTGSASPTITVSYTNSAGTSGRSATNYFTTSASNAGHFYSINLQSGDYGVQSVQSLTLSASWVSGTINLVAYRPLALMPLSIAAASSCSSRLDPASICLPRMYDGSVPFVLVMGGQAGSLPSVVGSIGFAQG